MKKNWLVESTLTLSLITSLAYADGDPDELYPTNDADNLRVAQAKETVTDDGRRTDALMLGPDASPPQTISIGGEDYALIPAAPLEPEDKRLDVYFSDKVGNLEYERSASALSIDNGRINAGFLFSEERDTVFSGGIMLDSDKDLLPGVRLSFGTRGYVALLGVENADVFGLSLGAEAEFIVPLEKLPLRLSASYFYAPDILAFGDADRIFDWDVNIGLQMRDSFMIYTGVRYLQMDTRPGKREVDDRLHVGVRWTLD